MTKLHNLIDASDKERVFVVGDIHGCFSMFEENLKKAKFDGEKDLCIMLGDLVDRGKESNRVSEFLDIPGVIRIVGNHEYMAYGAIYNGEHRLHNTNGGKWLSKMKYKHGLNHVRLLASRLMDAPYAITLKTPKGHRIGLVHADCSDNWTQFILNIENAQRHELSRAIWGGERYTLAIKKKQDVTVANIDHVFMGHTTTDKIVSKNNCTWLDTGACYGGNLTMLNVDYYLSAKGEYDRDR